MFLQYLKLLRKRNFFLLWLGQIVSQFGDRLTQIALLGLVSKVSASPSGSAVSSSRLAFVMCLAIIPVFILSPISGVYIDRWDKRKTMYISDALRGIFVLLIPLAFLKFNSLISVYALVFLSFCVGRFFVPAKMAFIPKITNKKDIFLANTLVSTTASIAALIGIGFGAIIFETYGTATAFTVDAVTFFISALAVFFIVVSNHKGTFYLRDIVDIGKNVVTTVKKPFIFEFKEGLKYIWTSGETKYAFKMFLFAFSYIGSLYVVFIRFIQETLSSLVKDVGFTVVSLAAGIFFGSLLYGRIAHKLDIKKAINASMFISSLYIIFFVIFLKAYPAPLHAIILGFGLGLFASPVIVGINTLIHKESDGNLLGRIFSGLEFISHLGFLIAMLICSLLADIFTPFTIIVSVGIIGAFISMVIIAKNDSHSRTQRTTA
ncbi:MAG: MFS transporter [Candidatus Omnitrophica bacterium]|nr:MFS transporter [Candidatus Omnitrophota bacterium]